MGIKDDEKIKFNYVIEGVNYISDEQKRMFEYCLPVLKELYYIRFVRLATIFNKKYKKWDKELDISKMDKKEYFDELNRRSKKVVEKFNKQNGDTVIEMDVTRDGKFFGHIKNIFDDKAIIYVTK